MKVEDENSMLIALNGFSPSWKPFVHVFVLMKVCPHLEKSVFIFCRERQG
jgi:hypothetical protein